MTKGFLYIANRQKFIDEAKIAARSLRDFTDLPIALVCTSDLASQQLGTTFDEVIINDAMLEHVYLAKVLGLQNSPFDLTIFMDSDCFVAADISNVFDLGNLVDIATTIEPMLHTAKLENIAYKNLVPEFNSGVIFFRKNKITDLIFRDWFEACRKHRIGNDMPGLREAILNNFEAVKFVVLPPEYNCHGFKTMLILHNEIKIIHERLGTKLNSTTPYFLPYEKGKKFAKKINRSKVKRLYLPYIGIIPFNYNLFNLSLKIKKLAGVKRTSKNR